MDDRRYLKIVISSISAILALQILVGVLVYFSFDSWDKRGQFGDVFGAANALFSGLAFAGLIFTALLQSEELSLQREELKETRKELQRSAKAQEESEKALRAQAAASSRSATLTSISFLLSEYKSELERTKNHTYAFGSEKNLRRDEIGSRVGHLNKILDKLYAEISGPTSEEQ